MHRVSFLEEASEYLVDGALVVKVRMRLSEGTYQSEIYPKLLSKDLEQIDEDICDIAFKVKGGIVKAHKCFIKLQAEDFYDMCESYRIESPMVIEDVDEIPFRIMLCSLYGVDVFPEEWQKYWDGQRGELQISHTKSHTVDIT
jgi:hypothetical protein